MKIKLKIGETTPARIKEIRKELNMTQKEICEILQIHQPNYSKYEKGELFPTVNVLMSLSAMSGVSIEYLLGLSNTKSKTHRSVYDCMETLTTLFIHSGIRGEMTPDGKLILSADEDKHSKMLKSIAKQSIDFAGEMEKLRKTDPGDIEHQHEAWLQKMKWQYSKEQLTDKRPECFVEPVDKPIKKRRVL